MRHVALIGLLAAALCTPGCGDSSNRDAGSGGDAGSAGAAGAAGASGAGGAAANGGAGATGGNGGTAATGGAGGIGGPRVEGDPCELNGVRGIFDGGVCNTEGVLLSGAPDAAALDAIRDLDIGDGVASQDIALENGNSWVLSQLELAIASGATVNDVNVALASRSALIVSAIKDVPVILIEFPSLTSLQELMQLADGLESEPSIEIANLMSMPIPAVTPFTTAEGSETLSTEEGLAINHHLAIRAPAAWNLADLVQVPPLIFVADYFQGGKPANVSLSLDPGDFANTNMPSVHGYAVLGVIGAEHVDGTADWERATGILPPSFGGSAKVEEVLTYTPEQVADRVIKYIRDKTVADVVLNMSFVECQCPSPSMCMGGCNDPAMALSIRKGSENWRTKTAGLDDRMLFVSAAGNRGTDEPAYTTSSWNRAALTGMVSNGLVVGSRRAEFTATWKPGPMAPSSASEAHVSGIGVAVLSLGPGAEGTFVVPTGTSIAAPQVAGLAAYVWSMEPALDAAEVVQRITDTAYDPGSGGANDVDIVDAYGAILARDTTGDAPVRLAILGRGNAFEEDDLVRLKSAFASSGGLLDYSAFDLNGDGMTGGAGKDRFDLDMTNGIDLADQDIEGISTNYNESALTDEEVLCYYAYSTLFTGNECERARILAGVCHQGPPPCDCAGCGTGRYIKARNLDAFDAFGSSVALSGDTLVVSAVNEDSGSQGNEDDNTVGSSGAVYVYERQGCSWVQSQYLKGTIDALDWFGTSLALDGDVMVVGAPYEDGPGNTVSSAGNAYVFERHDGTWTETAYLGSPTGQAALLGYSVAVDGDRIVVGAPTDLSADTPGAPAGGRAYVFERSGPTWILVASLGASNAGAGDSFGRSVAIDGDTIAVGAPREDSDSTGINGDETQIFTPPYEGGAVYVFEKTGSSWTQTTYVKASNTDQFDQFGSALALEGNTLVVAAPYEDSSSTGINGGQGNQFPEGTDSGAAYIFERSGNSWTQVAYVKSSNSESGDNFGGFSRYNNTGIDPNGSLSLSGDKLLIGANGESSSATCVNGNESDNSLGATGAAYLFERSNGVWSQTAYLKAPNTSLQTSGAFGGSVAIDGDTAVVGEILESTFAGWAGAAHVYAVP